MFDVLKLTKLNSIAFLYLFQKNQVNLRTLIELRYMKIVILADSYGGPRIHDNTVEVNENQTYPLLIKYSFLNVHDVEIDYKSFRKVADLPSLLTKYMSADVFVLQAGIVDAYPRVLNQERTISSSFINKLLRKIIRLNRAFFIKYVHSKTWVSELDYRKSIEQIVKTSGKKYLWVNIAPVNQFQEKETPGANESIRRYNSILSETIAGIENHFLVDVHTELVQNENYESFLHPKDSHLNTDGNKFYAELISKKLNTILKA